MGQCHTSRSAALGVTTRRVRVEAATVLPVEDGDLDRIVHSLESASRSLLCSFLDLRNSSCSHIQDLNVRFKGFFSDCNFSYVITCAL